MEKLLKPERLCFNADSSVAARNFKHWRRTFTNYLERHLEDDENAEQAKLNALTHIILTPNFFVIFFCAA